jgi:hypothetical protein
VTKFSMTLTVNHRDGAEHHGGLIEDEMNACVNC